MTEHEEIRPGVQDSLERVTELLRKHELTEGLVERQQGPRQELVENLVQKLHLIELRKVLDALHPADIAHILESTRSPTLPRTCRAR
jgi:magnesium transporter